MRRDTAERGRESCKPKAPVRPVDSEAALGEDRLPAGRPDAPMARLTTCGPILAAERIPTMRAAAAQSCWSLLSMLVVLLACAAHPGSASAATTGKPYSLGISPASVAAGARTTFSATFSNPAGAQQQLGSANLTAPAGLIPRSASVAGAGTASVSGSTVVLRDLALQPGSSVTVAVVADVSCSPATVTWAVLAKQANGFNGPPGNDLTLVAPSSLTTTIAGQCKLQFATQPRNARVGEPVTGTPYGPGPPVSVDVVDGAGTRVTTSSANVT